MKSFSRASALARRFSNAAMNIVERRITRVTSTSITSQPSMVTSGAPKVRFFSSGNVPSFVPMPMPALSPTMATGNIAKWKKNEGDELNPGDVIAEIETDKATVDFECQDSGYLARILVQGGTNDVKVGSIVAIMVESKEDAAIIGKMSIDDILAKVGGGSAAPSKQKTESAPAPSAPAASATVQSTVSPAVSTASSTSRLIASPFAKKIAAETGVDLKSIGAGSGPNGRIVAADVFEAKGKVAAQAEALVAAKQQEVPSARSGFTDVPVSSMRKVIAQRLTQSKQNVPHYYLSREIQLDSVLSLRTSLNGTLSGDSKLSVNDFLIKAAALACKKVPEVNSSWLENVIRTYDYVDVSVAVAVPEGLVTPIVRDAHTKGLLGISSGVRSLVEKAKAKKLAPEDYQGGTFTISNLGMFGVKQFAAIINPPQAAILAVGAAEKQVVPDLTPGAAVPYKQATVMTVTLSCDHRVVDGAVGAQWLAAFAGYLENPNTMLL